MEIFKDELQAIHAAPVYFKKRAQTESSSDPLNKPKKQLMQCSSPSKHPVVDVSSSPHTTPARGVP